MINKVYTVTNMSTQARTSTYFALMSEYGTGDIPLFSCCQKYFGMDEKKAGHSARHQKLPVPAYRGGSQKSMWLISTADLANYIDAHREKAKEDWRKMNGGREAA